LGSAVFNSSPVSKRTMSIRSALYTATTFNVAVRSTFIQAVVVGGTERYAKVGDRIAVRLVGNFTTIFGTTFVAIWTSGTGITTTIRTTVRCAEGAVGIHFARAAHPSCNIASRLSRSVTAVKDTTVIIGEASLAGTVGLAIPSASIGEAVSVILVVLLANVRVNAYSVIITNVVATIRERSVVGNAPSVINASCATTIFVTVLIVGAVTVTSTSWGTNSSSSSSSCGVETD